MLPGRRPAAHVDARPTRPPGSGTPCSPRSRLPVITTRVSGRVSHNGDRQLKKVDTTVIVEIDRCRSSSYHSSLHVAAEAGNSVDKFLSVIIPEQEHRLPKRSAFALDLSRVVVYMSVDEEQIRPAVIFKINPLRPESKAILPFIRLHRECVSESNTSPKILPVRRDAGSVPVPHIDRLKAYRG